MWSDNFRPGFSLIELIVVIAIVTAISALSLANFRGGERARLLRGSADEFTSLVRRTEARAIAGVVIPGTDITPAAYGVVVKDDHQAMVFADVNGNGCKDFDELAVETLELSDVITARPIITNALCSPEQVSFDTGTGRIRVNGACSAPLTEARYTLRHITNGSTKTVRINCLSGRIVSE